MSRAVSSKEQKRTDTMSWTEVTEPIKTMSRAVSSKEQKRTDTMPSYSTFLSPKLSIYVLVTCVILFLLFQIRSLDQTPSSPSSSGSSWAHLQQWHNLIINTTASDQLNAAMLDKLRRAVTFLPLKDYRYSTAPLQGHTWFMSSTYDIQQKGEVQYQRFPSDSSYGRVLCLRGRDAHDGSWNSYAFAWPEALPYNASFLKGLTFVSYNHYDYGNIWHGLSATVPFIAWHQRNGCRVPDRWVLYHWGEIRLEIGLWLTNIIHATFGDSPRLELLDNGEDDAPFCFEEAVVMRHSEGGMSSERRMEVYDLIRQKARAFCNVTRKSGDAIKMTMLMRTGARSFRNETTVVRIFERECAKVKGCESRVVHSSNLTFCEQVKVMGETDVLISPHGAQLTNMFLMDRDSSVMEFFPKGWLKVAGVGQYVYHWLASWSGMRHQGVWRDPDGDNCPYPDDDPRCMSVYKDALIGFNHTFFSQWATKVLNEVNLSRHNDNKPNIAPTCGL